MRLKSYIPGVTCAQVSSSRPIVIISRVHIGKIEYSNECLHQILTNGVSGGSKLSRFYEEQNNCQVQYSTLFNVSNEMS